MKFISFSAATSRGLDKKVNRFLEDNPYITIIETKFSAAYGGVYVGIFYKDK